MGTKGCGTCRDRKVRCDRTVPVCQRCSRAKRECRGYSLQLSWPNEKDRKRTIVANLPMSIGRRPWDGRPISTVNASSWDIEMHHYISSLRLKGTSFDMTQLLPPPIPLRLPWDPIRLNPKSGDLLQYCISPRFTHPSEEAKLNASPVKAVASYSLVAYGQNVAVIREVLLRMALSDGSPATEALMQSVLAVSYIHRFGPQPQANSLKWSALRALTASLATGINTKEALQHIAAGMLLCTFEAQQATDTSGLWIWHLFGAKDVIRVSQLLQKRIPDHDFMPLLLWVQYHDAMSSFSVRHWRRHIAVGDAYVKLVGERLARLRSSGCYRLSMPDWGPLSHTILRVLVSTCDYSWKFNASERPQNDVRAYFISCQKELLGMPIPDIGDELGPIMRETHLGDAADLELFRLATVVYSGRIADSLGQDSIITWVNKAFGILRRLDTYHRPFPLLIFGLEARTDERRAILLELISRTRHNMPARNLSFIELILQSIWVQDDLDGKEIGYADKLGIVLSSSETLPLFV